ncbi:MAG: 1-deoxy-D-xylulose-5-phosphate synthase, partial [Spirochaetae bacterium HGW-Spirochaetae-7]
DIAGSDPRVVGVVAAMAKGTGLAEFQRCYPSRLFDVGIAEEHAVTFAAGLAAGGLKPVVAIYSTFMQRTFDQVHHDVALAGRHVVFAVDRAGAVPDDGETHQGIYDIQAYRAVHGLAILAPASAVEVFLALRWALATQGPVIVRYPKSVCPPERPAFAEPFVTGRGVFVRRGGEGAPVLFAASGALVDESLGAADVCAASGLAADVYHLRFLKPVDTDAFVAVALRYRYVVIAEEGVLTGSVAADLAAAVSLASTLDAVKSQSAPFTRAVAAGFDERPMPQARREELLERAGLSAAALAETALSAMAALVPAKAAASRAGSGA